MLAFGYLFVGGYRLSRAMLLALGRQIIEVGNTGLAFGLLETANAAALMIAPIVAGFLYNQNPIYVYPASLGLLVLGFAFTIWVSSSLFHPKSNQPEITSPEV
jgi:hypothetical protein